MNTLTTWNPFRELDEVQNRFSTFFGLTVHLPKTPAAKPKPIEVKVH
jgi:hypothetical protein